MTKLSDICFERSTHAQEIYNKVKQCWLNNEPLILCSPQLIDIPKLEDFNIPKDMILGLFTSGTSTGKPRLVFYSKKNILSSLIPIRKLFDTSRIDHIFCYPQPTHVFGLVLGYIQSIVYEIPITFFSGGYSQKAHQLWNETLTSGTLTLGTPVHFFDLIRYNQERQIKPAKSYSSIVGGALTTVKLWNDMQTILNIESPSIGYGASEASPGISHLPPGVEPKFNGDVGYVLDGVNISHLTSDGFEFTGDNLCLGVIENNSYQSSKSILIRDHVVQQERFCIFGRSDLVINRGGLKYNPEILETALMSEGIKCLFLPVYDERLGQEIAILVEDSRSEDFVKKQIIELLVKQFQLKIKEQNIVFGAIPLNNNLKINRKEALKKIIKGMGFKLPISTQVLKSFMPHRGSAIWVDEIIDFKPRYGVGRIYIDLKKFYISDSTVRQSALIEFIAQTYGYSFVLEEIFHKSEVNYANNAFIAEIRDAKFSKLELLSQADLLSDKKKYLDVYVECTHDFIKIKVIKGSVFYQDQKLVELTMKVAVF